MAPARLIRTEKMEMPTWHVDRAGRGGETEADQDTVDLNDCMDHLLRFHDSRGDTPGHITTPSSRVIPETACYPTPCLSLS